MPSNDTVITGFKVQGQMVMGRRQFSPPFSFQDSLIDEARIVHVLSGQSTLVCAGKVLSLKPGDTLLMKADNFINQWHARDDNQRVDFIGFRLTRELLHTLYPQGIPALFAEKPLKQDTCGEAQHAFTLTGSAEAFESSSLLNGFMQSIIHYFQHPELFNETLVTLKLRELLALLPAMDKTGEIAVMLQQLFISRQPKLQEVVQTHLYTPLKIEDLAFLCHMSESTFSRHFKQVYGTTANKYLISKRLEKAQHLIRHSDDSLTQIAMECGFEELGYFSRVFKQHYNLTPSQLRKTAN